MTYKFGDIVWGMTEGGPTQFVFVADGHYLVCKLNVNGYILNSAHVYEQGATQWFNSKQELLDSFKD